ncbi:hypothetical protein FSW04_17455 [Baekduia soli]|uniref:Zf-HC2 domain-containing protein n=1 Tax=Baekduia soli TaxID=496014 RepID=A0A5B8U7V0_9ACTN|nr:hypothetical protein [Baekduia soli]QEC49186.1 hypothetical protein FSW04_17455 [Baekduia soli]
MDGSNASGATPEGVRAGDRAALQAVVDRRGPAVIAFCTQVCGPHDATRAAAEAFARFRAAVRDAPDLRNVDPEVLLRGATRHAAASMARLPVGPPPHGRLLSRGTQTCEHLPTMLAARANGALGEADLERMARHLDRCERCNALAEIFHRAELNYQDPPFDQLGTDTAGVLLEALEAVPMEAIGVGPAPDPDAPAVPVLDGAFGHLPDLEDEIPVQPPAAEAVVEVEQVAEPAEELDPDALVAEPLPEASPEPEDAAAAEGDSAEFETVYGETAEWDRLADAPDAGHDAPLVGAAAAGPLLEGGRQRSRGRVRAMFLVLPALLVTAAVVTALFISGVLGGNDATPPRAQHRAPVVQAPVTTPLPVTVAAGSSSAAGAAASTTSP